MNKRTLGWLLGWFGWLIPIGMLAIIVLLAWIVLTAVGVLP